MSPIDELPKTLPRWEIPSDWKWVSIADVGKVITGNTPPTKDESNYGTFIPFVKPPALTDKGIRSTSEGLSETGVRSSRTLPAGAVLVSCIGGLGKTGIAKVSVAFNQQINAIVFDQRVIPEFGFYYSQTLKPWLHGVASATTLPIVNKGKFQRAPFPLAPLDQQKRIVAEIEKQFSRLDEAVANLKRVKANLKRYKAAVLKAAVEGRLVETEAELARREGRSYETGAKLLQRILETRRSQWQGKGKYKEPAEPETTDLPALPEGWVWARLDAIAALKGGMTVDSKRKDPTARSIPYLRVANVQRGYLDLAEVKCIEAPESEIEALRLLRGDILFNEGGDRDKLGRGWIWEGQLADCIHQNHVFRARLYLDQLSPKLVSWWGNSFGKDYFAREGKQTTNLASINLTKLSAFPVPLPPAAEQTRITSEAVRLLSIIEGVESAVEVNLTRATRLRADVLSKAFGVTNLETYDERKLSLTNRGNDMPRRTLPELPPPRASEADDDRQDLLTVLGRYPQGVSAEQLLVDAGYKGDQVDQFYRDLAKLRNVIDVTVPQQSKKTWPFVQPATISLRNRTDDAY